MSRHEDIDNAIWSDPEFFALSKDAKLLYIWSWTNPRCGMAGLYKVPVEVAAMEVRMTLDDALTIFEELGDQKFAFHESGILWVRTRVQHLRSKSPKMALSIVSDLRKLPPMHPLVVRFMECYRAHPWLRADLGEAYREGIGNLSEKPLGKPDSHNLSVGSPEPPRSGTGSGISGLGDGGSGGKVDLPADFPEALRPHLVAVFRILRDLAERHNAKAVNPLSLASVLQARQRKPVVRAAHDFAAWADSKAQRRKDIVAGYRNWLDNVDDLAGLERLDSNVVHIADQRQPGKYTQAAMANRPEVA